LGALVGCTSFVEPFVTKVFYEDLGMIFNLPMFVDPLTAFAMLSLCYAQRLGYLFCIVFPFPGILQHYVKFNIRTITMLEKFFGVGSFGNSIDHLACCQTILLASSSGLSLFSTVQIVAPAFLGCWALIIPTLVTCFQ
jgi:hypothetical protein